MNFFWYENSRSDAFGKIFRYVKFLKNNHIFVIVRTKFFVDYYFYRCRFRTGWLSDKRQLVLLRRGDDEDGSGEVLLGT